MNKYHVYKWLTSYVLINRETLELQFFSTNYEDLMGTYHIENFTTEAISKNKVNGLIKRLNKGNYSYKNAYAVDKFIYNIIMNEEQKKQCNASDFDIKYTLAIEPETHIISGDEYSVVVKSMQKIVNDKVMKTA